MPQSPQMLWSLNRLAMIRVNPKASKELDSISVYISVYLYVYVEINFFNQEGFKRLLHPDVGLKESSLGSSLELTQRLQVASLGPYLEPKVGM